MPYKSDVIKTAHWSVLAGIIDYIIRLPSIDDPFNLDLINWCISVGANNLNSCKREISKETAITSFYYVTVPIFVATCAGIFAKKTYDHFHHRNKTPKTVESSTESTEMVSLQKTESVEPINNNHEAEITLKPNL